MKKTYGAPNISVMTFACEEFTSTSFGGGGGEDIYTPDDEF